MDLVLTKMSLACPDPHIWEGNKITVITQQADRAFVSSSFLCLPDRSRNSPQRKHTCRWCWANRGFCCHRDRKAKETLATRSMCPLCAIVLVSDPSSHPTPRRQLHSHLFISVWNVVFHSTHLHFKAARCQRAALDV